MLLFSQISETSYSEISEYSGHSELELLDVLGGNVKWDNNKNCESIQQQS